MGQAKSRGSHEQRIAEARARERAKFPESVKCNNCQADLTEIEPMDVRGIPGMRLAGGAVCQACNSTTWVLDGTEEGLDTTAAMLEQMHGGDSAQVGIAQRPKR